MAQEKQLCLKLFGFVFMGHARLAIVLAGVNTMIICAVEYIEMKPP
jgi:hypothetical protein